MMRSSLDRISRSRAIVFSELRELVQDLLPLEAGEPLELHVQDRLRLDDREPELGDEPGAGLDRAARRSDERDHGIEVVERDPQPFEDVRARLGLSKLELDAAPHDFAAELDEVLDDVEERQHARPARHDGQQRDAVARLQLRALVEIVQHDVRQLAALELDDDSHAFAAGFVAQIRNALDVLLADELRDLFDQHLLVDLIRNLGDDNRHALGLRMLLERGAAPDDEAAATLRVGADDALAADDRAAGRKVRARHELQDRALPLVAWRRPLLDHRDDAVDHFPHVVRRDARRHADGDACRAVDEQVRERRRQHRRFFRCLVEGRAEVHRLLVEVGHHRLGQ